MKKNILLTIMLGIISISFFGQGGTATNFRLGANFLGFNAGVPGDLQIRNNFANQPINFFAGGPQRMTILGTTGFVGIGLGFTTPASMLHIHDGIGSTFQMTNNLIGSTGANGFRILQIGAQIRLGQQELNDMFFHTGGSIALANERMLITGTAGPTQGFIGMGTNFTTPLSLLHISAFNNATGNVFRTDGNNNLTNIWEMYTGINPGAVTRKGALINIPFSTTFTAEATAGNFTITAAGVNSVANTVGERVRVTNADYTNPITGITTTNVGRVSISLNPTNPITNPASLLQIGDNVTPGFRPWMNVGTYITDRDNMYVGLKDEPGANRQDAVINWGNDSPVPIGPDNLRFIFTDFNPANPGGGPNGLETGRINAFGHWGIGNFYNSVIEAPFTQNPARRLEILSDKTVAASNGNPQLRLTNFQQDPTNLVNTGRFAELHDLQTGDLEISVRDNTQANTANQIFKERFVGINTITPGNTLEINSQFVSAATPNGQPTAGFGAPTGWAGLRFTDLQSTSIQQANPGTGLLSVNALGDVIYVPGNSGTGIGNYCLATPNPLVGTDYEIPLGGFNYRYTGQAVPLQAGVNTDVVGIGYACGNIMPAKFNVLQDAGATVGVNTTAGDFLDVDIANTQGLTFTGVSGIAQGVNPLGKIVNRGGYFSASNAADVRGVVAELFPSANNTAIAAGGEFNVSTKATANYGVLVTCTGVVATAGTNIGVFARASGSDNNNIGGSFVAPISTTGQNIGVGGAASGSTLLNIAGSFVTSLLPTPTGSNIAVFGRVGTLTAPTVPANNAIAIYGNSASPLNNGVPGFAGYFDGDVFLNGPSTGTGYALTSDSQFKTNIDSIGNADSLLSQLLPKTFYFDTTNVYGLNFSSQKQYGLIAQDVETIMPELITNVTKAPMVDTLGNIVTPGVTYKSLNYNAFIAILIKGHQSQQSKIDSLTAKNADQDSINTSLQNQINQLATIINECCSNHSMQQNNNSNSNTIGSSSIDVNLKDGQSIVLDQNTPNPFAEQTTINYFLPDDVNKAQILFYNLGGKLIQSTELTQKGKGSINVFAQDLSNGIYTYTLVVDGKIIETKKMIKQ